MALKARNLFGPKKAKRTRQTKPPPPKTARQRQLGTVSPAYSSPRRVLPAKVGAGPDPVLVKLLDNASGLGECNARLKVARPELAEPKRFELLRKHFGDINVRWLSSGKGGARKELARLASRNSTGFELDFVEDGPETRNDD
jgi:hypothetical protein